MIRALFKKTDVFNKNFIKIGQLAYKVIGMFNYKLTETRNIRFQCRKTLNEVKLTEKPQNKGYLSEKCPN